MLPCPSGPSTLAPEVWTRARAVSGLRQSLLKLCGDGASICQVASERRIFCRGFRRWHDREFHERWRTTLGSSTHLTREQTERLADIWQLCEQLRHGVTLACDAQAAVPGACRGWNEFSDGDLERFCGEILGRAITIRRDGAAP